MTNNSNISGVMTTLRPISSRYRIKSDNKQFAPFLYSYMTKSEGEIF